MSTADNTTKNDNDTYQITTANGIVQMSDEKFTGDQTMHDVVKA